MSEQLEDKAKDKNKNRNEDQQPRANAAILSSNPANGLVNEPNPAARADVSQVPTYQPQTTALTSGRSIGGPVVNKDMGFGSQPQPSLAQNQSPVPAAPSAFARQRGASTAGASPAPSASEAVEVTGQAPLVAEAQTQTAKLQSESVQPQSQSDNTSRVGKAKPVVTLEAAAAAPAAQPETSTTSQPQIQTSSNLPINGRNVADLTILSPPPRWNIGATGTLQRSFDQGKTWQDVNVIASAVSSSYNGMTAEATPQLSRDKNNVAAKTSLKRAPISTFRAVSATGSEVWAGGSPSVLYHSSDVTATSLGLAFFPSANGNDPHRRHRHRRIFRLAARKNRNFHFRNLDHRRRRPNLAKTVELWKSARAWNNRAQTVRGSECSWKSGALAPRKAITTSPGFSPCGHSQLPLPLLLLDSRPHILQRNRAIKNRRARL